MGNDDLVKLRLIPTNKRMVDRRERLGLRQDDLGGLLGLSGGTISQIETLKVIPSQSRMEAIAMALGTTAEYLFPEELLGAVRVGVFLKREAVLEPGQLLALTSREAQKLLTAKGLDEAERAVDNAMLGEAIEDALYTLNPRERRVLQLRFGLEDGQNRTLEEVGQELGVSKGRIHEIEARALRRLREPRRSRRLKNFLD